MKAFDLKNMPRREFIKFVSGVAATPLMASLTEMAYAAGPYSDYKALVCVFLFGGNDSHNMIVPLDSHVFADYVANRGPLALPFDEAPVANKPWIRGLNQNKVSSTQGDFGFHPRMYQLTDLYKTGKLAVVANAGVLIEPTTQTSYRAKTVDLPPQLFSHSDMQQHWHTAHPQAPALDGWGGRLGELIKTSNDPGMSVSITTANGGIFMKGGEAVAHQIGAYRSATSPIVQRIRAYRDGDFGDNRPNTQTVYEANIAAARGNLFEDQFGNVATRSIDLNNQILSALYDKNGNNYTEKTSLNVPAFPANNPLAAQLRSVALMIAAQDDLGAKRQIFFVSVGGSFDTHSDQFDDSASPTALKRPANDTRTMLYGHHADLYTQLDEALKAFYDATVSLGVADKVTTFTESDFGRTLTSNGKGSDHGWGGHQLVMGGGVNGGDIYGAFHNMKVNNNANPNANPYDAGQGRLIPGVSVDQYAATLSKWMGVSNGELATIFPNLVNFTVKDLGFMKP